MTWWEWLVTLTLTCAILLVFLRLASRMISDAWFRSKYEWVKKELFLLHRKEEGNE